MHLEAVWIPVFVAAGGLALKGVQLGVALARKRHSPDSDPAIVPRREFDAHVADDREAHATFAGKLEVFDTKLDSINDGITELRKRR